MKTTPFPTVILSAIISLSGLPLHAEDAPSKRPNIIFLLSDKHD